ncbi:cysteine--tRNA ligase [Buchnera aphidicola]|uniref:cysteine--tRNA ligase n=1 Tax=Buchnera aphidicola TaxID=9 RepID=UPI0031B82ECF
MLKIFNTKTKKKEKFIPIIKNNVNVYVCGVTVYDFCHFGHGRTFVIFDMIVRYLKFNNFNVVYVRNITDIDDKIINKSFIINKSINIFTKKIIKIMNYHFNILNIKKPDYEPKVTYNINYIIFVIKKLLNNKYAYSNIINNKKKIFYKNDILFSIKKDINYGVLSNRFLKNNFKQKNKKKFFFDFVLWKISKNNEPSWLSPWGFGRPGWHIECSAIHKKYFKKYIDIHGGGSDLIFPHHENELSQSTCLNNNYLIKYWLHSGVVIINNQKMSKSLGNSLYLKNLFNKYHGEVIRYYCLTKNYRKPLIFKKKNIYFSFLLLKKLYLQISYKEKKFFKKKIFCLSSFYVNKFLYFMNDDFNTSKALKLLNNLSKKINIYKKKYILQNNVLIYTLFYLGRILGFFYDFPFSFLNFNKNLNVKKKIYIKKIIKKRNKARKQKKWFKADFLKKKLIKLGVSLQDTIDGTIWFN